MDEVNQLIELLTKKEKLTAMLAPSFPIVFNYPSIITMLKKLGFSYTIEVAVGAKKTNEELLSLLQANPTARYITSPCPTIVRMVKKTMPQYAKYFTHNVDSPMAATAKIVREKFPESKPVFIGPCVLKKMEAKEDIPELNIVVITYKELQDIFNRFAIKEETNPEDHFDIGEPGMTRLYALDGGLSHSSGLTKQLKPEQIKIVSGVQNNIAAIKEFEANPAIKLLDILNCPGGCIGGPGIVSSLNTMERAKKIGEYIKKQA